MRKQWFEKVFLVFLKKDKLFLDKIDERYKKETKKEFNKKFGGKDNKCVLSICESIV